MSISMKQQIRRFASESRSTSITRGELAEALDVRPDGKADFGRAMGELEEEGFLVRAGKGRFSLGARSRDVTGRLQCSASGFGFLIPDPGCGLKNDVYIASASMGDAVHGDRVAVEILGVETQSARRGVPRRGGGPARKTEGRVIKVLERAEKRVIGKIFFFRKPIVTPLDARYQYSILVDDLGGLSLSDGDVVSVEVTAPPSGGNKPSGRVHALVGKPDDPDLPMKIIMARHDIRQDFPESALAEARAMSETIQEAEWAEREDMRHLPAVTVDPETAHDFDDAVNVARGEKGDFTLWVHIADVSWAVRPGGVLDSEAFARGTSAYFPDRAVPMLPLELSSDVCSLLPGRDRRTFTAVLTVNGRTGKILGARFTPSVIRSRWRLTYRELQGLLDGGGAPSVDHADLAADFRLMARLASLLNRRRMRRGAVDLDLPADEILFSPEGTPSEIRRTERLQAHRIVEEFMLAANEAVAAHFHHEETPSLYRVHDTPDPVKVGEFMKTASCFGHAFDADPENLSAKAFQKMASSLGPTPVGRFLSFLLLRSFKLAVYSPENIGHFGLASPCYTHFTSPIRRYPDLVVHRLLRLALKGLAPADPAEVLPADLAETARRSSDREREATEAEREAVAWQKARYMHSRLGETSFGFITTLRPNGFFVELEATPVEGFVNLAVVRDDYYAFDEARHILVGERTGRTFRLGERVRIRVDKVDLDRYHIDLSLDDTPEISSGQEGDRTPTNAHRNGDGGRKTRRTAKRTPRSAAGFRSGPAARTRQRKGVS